ncbi:MAG: hypothetical protein H7Y38_17875 [Armatimonadetes bacterium]|nr:hypothetical protein [Armatimonadota bacterium]
MWIYLEHEANCINSDHVSRMYVESTGSGAALKADLSGKTVMLGYYENRDDARDALKQLIHLRETGVAVVRLER